MSTRTTILLLLLCLVGPWAAGVPVQGVSLMPREDVMGSENPPPQVGPGNCQTERSDDYYGLGVRLGIYMAWIQAWVAFNWVPSEIAGALDTNTIFLVAVVLAMVRCTITGLIVQVDGLILMHLGAGTIFGVLSIWGYRTSWYLREGPAKGIAHFGGLGTHARLLLCVAFASYGLYFWMKGIYGPNPGLMAGSPMDTDPDCLNLYTFMFTKLRADGGIRYFYITMCCCCLLYWGIMLVTSSLAGVARVVKLYNLARYNQWRTTSRLHFATGYSQKQLRRLFFFLSSYTLIWMIFSMTTVEMTLNYNKMLQVLGWRGHFWFPSQLIPAVIGACGLLRVLYVGFEQWRSPTDAEPSLPRDVPIDPGQGVTMPHGRSAFRLFAARTLANATNVYSSKYDHHDDEMDPLLEGQAAWLRCLVSYLPWLVLVRWWHLADEDYEWNLYEHPNLQIKPRPRHGGPPGRTIPLQQKHHSWGSDEARTNSPSSARFSKEDTVGRPSSSRAGPTSPTYRRQ
ncbi:hypothetical protein GQ53DRAFT_835835 [Thozetella sp. PMI_491]|nr:hypothetical protein GQ53DRAFT_835835 [Thozetella sp. PMI_491]